MKVPAIAKKTFDELNHLPEFMGIVQNIIEKISKLSNPLKRAHQIHKAIDDFNVEVFAHPIVQQFSPCKLGCSACCHTQVSVTDDEAKLLIQKVSEGIEIDWNRLEKQASVGNESAAFFRLNFEDRKCVFLDDSGACSVYLERPSVCRTNAVLGEAKQCHPNQGGQSLRLVRTPKADMVIYASFLFSKDSGTLPFMLKKSLDLKQKNLISSPKEDVS